MRTLLALALCICLGTAQAQVVAIDAAASTVKWLGAKATGQHNGTISIQEGKLELNGDNLIGGSFSIDMTTISCEDLPGRGKAKLENHLKSDDFFGVEVHPLATFKITNVKAKGNGTYEVTGDMTIKNITKEVAFMAKLTQAGNQLQATATLTIDRSEFNVRYGSGSFFDNLGDRLIYDDFELTIALIAK